MSPKITVVYIAVANGPKTAEFCARFVGTWLNFPPGIECNLTVVCNGGPLPLETAMLFVPLDAAFFPRVNDGGFDIGGFQAVAAQSDSDMIFCCGESVYFHKEGWLRQLAQAWSVYGPGMYGVFSSNLVRAHLNTTAFAISPKLLSRHPKVTAKSERYEFEHGETALWRRLNAKGAPTKFVTWDGVWEPRQWRIPKNILWRGDQSNLLAFCNHTDRYWACDPRQRQVWQVGIDSPFK